jgi:hypothetical protein
MSLPRSGFAATSNAGVQLIARSTIEACRALINDLHRPDAALSDNSIQTTTKSLPAFLRSVGGKQESFWKKGCRPKSSDSPSGKSVCEADARRPNHLRHALPCNFSSRNDG